MGYDWVVKKLSDKSIVAVIGHNRIGGVTRCVNSFIRQLGKDDRALIIDNQAEIQIKQEIKEIKKKYRKVEVVENNNLNIASARNLALSYAKKSDFKYCLFLDDDCVATSDWFKSMLSAQKKYSGAWVIVGNVKYVPESNVYSLLEQELWDRWIKINSKNGWLTVIDTKNSMLILDNFISPVFDTGSKESNGRKSDIKLAVAINDSPGRILFANNSLVWHHERPTFFEFVKKKTDSIKSDKILINRYGSRYHKSNNLGTEISIFLILFKRLVLEGRMVDISKLGALYIVVAIYKVIKLVGL